MDFVVVLEFGSLIQYCHYEEFSSTKEKKATRQSKKAKVIDILRFCFLICVHSE